jgi:hypothetical protein
LWTIADQNGTVRRRFCYIPLESDLRGRRLKGLELLRLSVIGDTNDGDLDGILEMRNKAKSIKTHLRFSNQGV